MVFWSNVAGTFMTDCDVGEIFLNFMVEPDLRSYAGVDLVFSLRTCQLRIRLLDDGGREKL